MAGGLRVLGPFEVVDDDGPVRVPAKQQRLLAALVVEAGRTRTVDDLVEAVWDGSAPPSARKLLQVYVSQLRSVLPADIRIATRSGGYALEVEPEAIDAVRFERLLAEAGEARRGGNAALAASLADQALALWSGPAFGDLAYEELAVAEARRLEELRLAAVEERLDAQLELGRHVEVLPEILRAASEHPLRERLQAQVMLALYRSGRQSEALERYADTRRALRDELGLEPGPLLQELQRRVLQHDPALAGSTAQVRTSDLPEPPTPLVGRARDLAQLRRLLERREARLLVLTGAGGSGKTRLALEAVRSVERSFANGAVLVELAPLRDPSLVVATIAHALDVPEVAGEDHEETLVQAIATRELLLLIDNAEHLLAAASLYSRLVARAPRLTMLVTSRAVLHVSGEHVWPVTPLEEDDALELFVRRARRLEPSFEPTAGNEATLREICRRVDGLPLAIELAAARIRALSPQDLLARLGERLALLTAGPRDLPARQQTLRETIDWSVALLDEPDRRVLARLGAFPGGATLAALEEVCGADLDRVSKLVDNSLVRRFDAAGELRFGLLETIAEYARGLLGDERRQVEHALATYLTDLVESATLKGPGSELWLPRLDAELDNLRVAFDAAAATGDSELELRLAGGLWRYWWIRGMLDEGMARLDAALARADGSQMVARARALAGAAGLAYSRGDARRARELALDAADCASACGELYAGSSAHVVLGVLATAEHDWATARSHLQRSIELAVELGVAPTTEMLNLANVESDSGDFEAAIAILEELVEVHRSAGSDEGEGFALLNLALARYRRGGEDAEARREFIQARERFTALGFRAHVGHSLLGSAAVEARAGNHAEAAGLLGAARAHLSEVGWSSDDFEPGLDAAVEQALRAALGDEAFTAAQDARPAVSFLAPPVMP